MNKEQQLNVSFLLYASQCAQEGNFTALRAMGFSSDQDIQILKDMHVSDLSNLAHQGHVINVNVNLPAFRLLSKHIHNQREADSVLDALIHREAPFELLHALNGISKTDYINRRRLARLRPSQGRPRRLTQLEEKALWDAWPKGLSTESAAAEIWLDVAEETGLELRTVWSALRALEREGEIFPTAPATPRGFKPRLVVGGKHAK